MYNIYTWHCIHVIVPRETMTIPRCIMNYHIMYTSIPIDIGEGLHYLETHSTIYGIPTKYSGDFCIFKSLCIRLYLYLLFGALIQSKPFVCKHTYICLIRRALIIFEYIYILYCMDFVFANILECRFVYLSYSRNFEELQWS